MFAVKCHPKEILSVPTLFYKGQLSSPKFLANHKGPNTTHGGTSQKCGSHGYMKCFSGFWFLVVLTVCTGAPECRAYSIKSCESGLYIGDVKHWPFAYSVAEVTT